MRSRVVRNSGARLTASALAATMALAMPLATPLTAQSGGVALRQSPRASVQRVADASDVPALARVITLRLHQVGLGAALQEIARRGDLSVTYSPDILPAKKRVTLVADEIAVDEALKRVLQDSGLEIESLSSGHVVVVRSRLAPATKTRIEPGTVTGRVTVAESNEGLTSATITVLGTRLGAITNAEGRFTIANVPEGQHWVRAQRLGFGADSQQVTVGSGQTVTANFALRTLAVQLSAVVAIGYGTTERKALTGSVASISAEELASQPTPMVDQALLGRAPGVQVVTSSGQPGSGTMVRIRGGNSIGASNEPLYVIDGVPIIANATGVNTQTLMTQGASGLNPVSALNSEDIESIEVLKDASSSAIYGARAANGVVLITTKRGRNGQNTVNIGAYYGRQSVRRTLPLLTGTEFATLVNTAYTNAGQPAPYSATEVSGFGRGTNWQDVIFRDAPVQNYELSFSGGDPDTRYYVSGNLLRNEGTVIGTFMNRGTARLNFDQDLSRRFRIGTRFSFSRSDGQVLPNGGNGQEVSSVVLNAVLAPPIFPVRTDAGEYFTANNPLTGRPFSNPVASALEITNREQQNRAIGNAFAEYDLAPGLVLKSTFGADYLSSRQDFYSPSNTLPGRNFGGYGSRGTAQTTSWLNEETLQWYRQFGGNELDLLGGLTFQKTSSDNISGTAQGFLTDRLRENGLNTAATFVGVFTGAPHSSLMSYFARAHYGIADKYLFTLTGRVDGSSKFGEGNQYGVFPSAAFAWRASEESFLRDRHWFDDLKFRLSYGRTGNQDIGNYNALATLRNTVYVFGDSRAIGYVPASLANADLKWETTDEVNGGVDMAVLSSRVSLTADYYSKKTRDLLLQVPVPSTSGFGSSLQNIGSVRNRGLELGLNTVNLAGALGWTSSFNISWNRNRVVSLGPDSQIVAPTGVGAGANQNPTILRVGQPINAFYGWVFDRMEAGEVVYKDLNGDGDVTEEDRAIIGNAQPNYTGGLSNRFTYRGLGLTVFLQWSQGNKIYNINRALLTSTAGNVNQLTDVLHAGAGGIPDPKIGNTFESRPSTLFVENGSYLRGKNIRLDWIVPQRWLEGRGFGRLNSLQLYVSAQNFFTRTSYSGFDPEISEYALSNLAQGFDFGTFPQARQITFGFNTSF